MTATIHKISAGCGYEYLTRQVAAMDATDKGRVKLADYYSAKGESPGRWLGSGLAGLSEPVPNSEQFDVTMRTIEAGQVVTADQMRALFGEGRHPNADELEAEVAEAGGDVDAQLAESALGNRWSETTAQPEYRVRLAERFIEHNLAAGQHWSAPINDETKAALRTDLALQMFTEEYDRTPADDRELSGWMAKLNRPRPQGVAGYDLTFSPVKSVSTLWAIGYLADTRTTVDGRSMDVSQVIEHAHDRAVADAISFIEEHAAFSRLGTDGVQQVDSEGLIATAFTHRDARSGDPDLHTHVAVANKVRVRVPGSGANGSEPEFRWVALDGTPLYKAMVSASEVYNSRLEAHLRSMLGVSFSERPSADKSKRAVREVDGVPHELMDRWSQRRIAIERRQAELAAEFQATHHREPTTTELYDLAQQANLDTREAKHEPRSLNEQRETWHTQAVAELGSEEALAHKLSDILHRPHEATRESGLSAEEATAIARSVISTVSAGRAHWQRPHLRAEAERQLRMGSSHTAYTAENESGRLPWTGWIAADHWAESVEKIVRAAEQASILQAADITDSDQNEPSILRRQDGHSIYSTHETALFTNDAIMSAERRIVASARRTDGRKVDPLHVDLALLEAAANERALNAGQTTLVRELATSGRRVQLALAPAGTGKTYAMRTFGTAWRDSGGSVIGLAPTAAAAAVLREDLGTETDTLAKLVHVVRQQQHHDQLVRLSQASDEQVRHRAAEQLAKARPPKHPDWFSRIDSDTVIIVDEAGMASTEDLDVLIAFAQTRGAAVRLVGDDQQLASISAGGVLRDIAHESGALTLSQVVRFSDGAEGAASLALREGDIAGLGYLADHDRIHVAADTVAADQAFTAWVHDRAEGHDAVMLAATRETTNNLNEAARNHRIDGLDSHQIGPEIQLADGLTASVGDTICTRRNNRTLRTSATDWVRNGDRWEITAITTDGTITARHKDRGRSITLPADYVNDHVTLGYASTIHAAQGMTADHCHVVGSDSLTRQLLYVAMTRGRHSNHIYLSTAEGDPHKVLTPKALTPGTAVEVLAKVLDRDEAQRSATTSEREARDPFTRLGPAVRALDDAIGTLAEAKVGTARLTEIIDAARKLSPTIVEASAWPVLRKHLAVLDLNTDTDPVSLLITAYRSRELDSAQDAAAVLDWRLDPEGMHSRSGGPLPWISGVPTGLPDDQTAYLDRRSSLVSDLADEIRTAVTAWTINDAPAWARPFVAMDAPRDLVADLALFRATHDVPATDLRPSGPPHLHTKVRVWQKQLDARASQIVSTGKHAERWTETALALDPHIVQDPYWPRLAEQLTDLDQAGLDVAALTTEAIADDPLPTELPAAALWWRLSRNVDQTTLDTADSGLRPDWINDVGDVLGTNTAEVVIADPAWPALVTAVDGAVLPDGWSARELLTTATESLYASADMAGENLRADQLARALARRVEHLGAYDHDYTAPLAEEPLSEAELGAHPDLYEPDHDPYWDNYADESAPDEYFAAVLADGPPADVDHEPEPERWPDLDFDDHYIVDPTTPAPEPVRDFAALIADHYELAARRREITDDIAQLTAAIDRGEGPHTRALEPNLFALRANADAQRPYRIALDEATSEQDELAEHLTDLTAQITGIDDQLAALGKEPAYDDTPDLTDEGIAADELRTLRATLMLQRKLAERQVSTSADRVQDARAALTAAEIEHGGRAITGTDVTVMRLSIESIDREALDTLREDREQIDNRLLRTESALAHRYALTRQTSGTVYSLPQAQHADTLATVAAELAADPVRQVSTADLHSTIRAVRKRIARIREDLHVTGTPTTHEADLRRDHARVDEQIAAITKARTAESLAAEAKTVLDHARANLVRHQHETTAGIPRAQREQHAETHRRLIDTLDRAAAAHRTLEEKARHAALEVSAPPAQWPTIVASADPRRRAAALDRARTQDTRAQSAADKDRDALESATAKLTRALAEVERREALTPEQLDLEEQARETQTATDHAAKRPNRVPVTPMEPAPVQVPEQSRPGSDLDR